MSATRFLPLVPRRYPRYTQSGNPAETKFWEKFEKAQITKSALKVTDIDICESAPHDLAVCASTRVDIIDAATLQTKKTISRFKDVALCAAFRTDGKLLVAGSADKTIQVFDLASRMVLRTFSGHRAAVQSVGFEHSDVQKLFSGSDDHTIRRFDMITQQTLSVLTGHTDNVRAVLSNPFSADTLVSGSYDHTVKVWDTRLTGNTAVDSKNDDTDPTAASTASASSMNRGCTMTMNHGAPIEAITLLTGSGLLVTAGDNKLKVWSLLTGGMCIATLSPHSKTITSLCTDSSRQHLISGALDQRIKVIRVTDYQEIYSFKHSAPVLAVNMSPDSNVLAVGMSDGSLALRQHSRVHAGPAYTAPAPAPRPGSKRHFMRGASAKASIDDFAVTKEKSSSKLTKPYDSALKNFDYTAALDAALHTKKPEIVMALLEELLLRGGLRQSLANRNEATLTPILDFCVRYITQPRHTSLLCDCTNMLLDIYSPTLGQSMSCDEKFLQLKQKVEHETALQKSLHSVIGAIDILIAASITPPAPPMVTPSPFTTLTTVPAASQMNGAADNDDNDDDDGDAGNSVVDDPSIHTTLSTLLKSLTSAAVTDSRNAVTAPTASVSSSASSIAANHASVVSTKSRTPKKVVPSDAVNANNNHNASNHLDSKHSNASSSAATSALMAAASTNTDDTAAPALPVSKKGTKRKGATKATLQTNSAHSADSSSAVTTTTAPTSTSTAATAQQPKRRRGTKK